MVDSRTVKRNNWDDVTKKIFLVGELSKKTFTQVPVDGALKVVEERLADDETIGGRTSILVS